VVLACSTLFADLLALVGKCALTLTQQSVYVRASDVYGEQLLQQSLQQLLMRLNEHELGEGIRTVSASTAIR
jgi:predicted component of type VI protein secretion system